MATKPLSERSEKNLKECRGDLQRVFRRVHEIIPCEIIEGKRGQDEQDLLFAQGKTKVRYPNSKHNKEPLSWAVDAIPLPIDWKNTAKIYLFAGIVLGVAAEMKVKIRWGGDWNMNMNPSDESFLDLVHFELVE